MPKINNSDRIMIGIPKNTDLHKFLLKNNKKTPYWKLLEEAVKHIPESKEDRSILIFNNFVEELSELYPEVNGNLEKLRPLVFKHIIKKECLDPWYFEELKNNNGNH